MNCDVHNSVLIVEDDPGVRDNLRELLCSEGYQVTCAEHGMAALSLIRDNAPAVVICDVMMPELDGYDLLRTVRSDPALVDTQVLLLTAKAEATDIRRGMDLGADDYITKPFRSDDVLRSVAIRTTRHNASVSKFRRSLSEQCEATLRGISSAVSHPVEGIRALAQVLEHHGGHLTPPLVSELSRTIKRDAIELLGDTDDLMLALELSASTTIPTRFRRTTACSISKLLTEVAGADEFADETAQRDIEITVQGSTMDCTLPQEMLRKVLRSVLRAAVSRTQRNGKLLLTGNLEGTMLLLQVTHQPSSTMSPEPCPLPGTQNILAQSAALGGVPIKLASELIARFGGVLTFSIGVEGGDATIRLPVTDDEDWSHQESWITSELHYHPRGES